MGHKKKKEQLGMHPSTAYARLRKEILWKYIVQNEDNICFRCHGIIRGINDLSIEHKVPWLDSEKPLELFFHSDNIAFSHLKCNVGAARKLPQTSEHGQEGATRYRDGCRCEPCRGAQARRIKKQRAG